jgi:hypothetical protein
VTRAVLRHCAARAYNLLRASGWSAAKIRTTYKRCAGRAHRVERRALYHAIAERAAIEV